MLGNLRHPLTTGHATSGDLFDQRAAERETFDRTNRNPVPLLNVLDMAWIEVTHHPVKVEQHNGDHKPILPRVASSGAVPRDSRSVSTLVHG
jgi:hypothetical protein